VTTVTKKTAAAEESANDQFVPDRVMRGELNISPMTTWRYDHDPAMTELGWPPIIRIGAQGRKYRSRAIAARGGEAA
jgi:hypothetical protein